MIGIKNLLNMVATESIECSQDHYFDEFRNREYIDKIKLEQPKSKREPLPIRYNLELIQNKDDSLEWVE